MSGHCPGCGAILGVQADPGIPIRHLNGKLERCCWDCSGPVLYAAVGADPKKFRIRNPVVLTPRVKQRLKQ